MNDTSTSPVIMGLLFVLRCLVPLGILLGVSYLLRRMELIVDQTEEERLAQDNQVKQQTPAAPEAQTPAPSPRAVSRKQQKSGKKKPITPKKKES